MSNAYFYVPKPSNEPVLSYAAGSPERAALDAELARQQAEPVDIPLVINGQDVRTGNTVDMHAPHDHSLLLGTFQQAGADEVEQAIAAALSAREAWADMPWEQRISVFLRAAELLAGPWRAKINAATMLGQSKTVHQAEIDSACELIDFLRFNAYFMSQIMADQPMSSAGVWNRVEYRALEGFVLAVTPFNFSSIAGNLPTAPAMVGNVALWKPASSAVLSAYYFMRLLQAAGLPDGVINFVPGPGRIVGPVAIAHPELAGIHFTGSTGVFHGMWRAVAENIEARKYYPRVVGETGGKDFIFAHQSADIDELVVAALRGAFEYQGQKCSAASRLYVPRSLWPAFKEKYTAEIAQITMGPPTDYNNFFCAVIDRGAYKSIKAYIDGAKADPDVTVLTGGGCDDSVGFYIEPTTLVTENPKSQTMCEEIFGPVLTIFVYDDEKLDETLQLVDETSPYALTGAIFGRNRHALTYLTDKLRNAAGNFYINDKPTGAVVGQQPFGGGRASGTNDKAGSAMNMLRWMTVRTIKENLLPPTEWRYPFMDNG